MPQRTRQRIDKGLYLVNGVVYMELTKGGLLHRRKAGVQMSAALNARGEPTKDLRKAYREFCDAIENETFRDLKRLRSDAPTVARLAEVYREAAAERYALHGQPRPMTAANNVTMFLALARDVGTERLDGLTAEAVDAWAAARCRASAAKPGGIDRARVSAWSIVAQARSLWAAWTAPYYAKAGLRLPDCLSAWTNSKTAGRSSKYQRPPEELRQATVEWYAAQEQANPAVWLAATLMLQFAMRPEDAAALTWERFERRPDGNRTLHYVPSKTRERTTRLREVRWPVDNALFERMRAAGGEETVIPGDSHGQRYDVFAKRLNGEMRGLGWTHDRYGKACYELRKMCIDRTRCTMGLDRAVQISGDSHKTVSDYYSDPNMDSFGPVDLAVV